MAFCTQCGAPLQGSFCVKCGAAANATTRANNAYPLNQGTTNLPQGAPHEVSDFLVWNVFATICCCLPFGIVGLVYSIKCQHAKEYGFALEAVESGKKALMWFWIAIGSAVVGFLASCTFLVLYQR